MKKILAALCLISISMLAAAQKPSVATPVTLPTDSITKLITYEGVIEVKGVSADELYRRINDWFHSYYKNPTEVIRTNDSTAHKMIGKPRFRMSNPPDKEGTRTDAGITQYTITVAAKDGRYKYELTEFNWKQLSYFACEKWMDTKSPSYTNAYSDFLTQLDKYAIETIASLRDALTHAKSVKDKDSW
ncbi:MAG: DUF4468 domain-containing protein [Bacteroidetes bacterium]|nr:DUF4468 domain-containing protein [Bacteroidota bacterium]